MMSESPEMRQLAAEADAYEMEAQQQSKENWGRFGADREAYATIHRQAYEGGLAEGRAQRDALLAACKQHPLPPSDFDTFDGKEAFCDAVMQWLNGPVAAAIALAEGRNRMRDELITPLELAARRYGYTEAINRIATLNASAELTYGMLTHRDQLYPVGDCSLCGLPRLIYDRDRNICCNCAAGNPAKLDSASAKLASELTTE